MSFLAKASRMLGTLKRRLGEEMLYRHNSGGSVTICAVWNREHEIVDADTETVVSTNNPHIGVQLSDLLMPPVEDDEVVFCGITYRVVDVEEDGQGAAQIQLFKHESSS